MSLPQLRFFAFADVNLPECIKISMKNVIKCITLYLVGRIYFRVFKINSVTEEHVQIDTLF